MDDLTQAAKYGDDWARIYDEWHPFDDNAEAAVETLTRLSNGGQVLELAIGSGRIGLSLANRGVDVRGIESSQAMIDLLRAKRGGEAIPVTVGNLRDVAVDGQFEMVFVAFNTIYALLTQEEQVLCFQNVAARLTDAGCFVVEAFVPTAKRRLEGGQAVRPTLVADDEVRFHLLSHDAVAQQIHGQTISMTRDGHAMYPSRLRYIWPSEMDLMARLAGLRLRERWSDWDARAFDDQSVKHVSIYEKERPAS